MSPRIRLHAALLAAPALLLTGMLQAGQPNLPAKKDEPFTIKESDLQRLPVKRMSVFPWEEEAAKNPKPVKPPEANAPANAPGNEGMIDVSAGDVEIGASGPFSRVASKMPSPGGKDEDKEVLTLQKDVEIFQPGTGSVLRGQTIKVTRDVESGDMERLEAKGQVEIITGDRKAKGETLVYETRFGPAVQTPAGPRKEVLLNIVTVEGDPATRKPATLWSGDDAIQAMKVVMDIRRDTFRALGGALVQVRLPPPDGATPGTPPTPGTPGKAATPATPAKAATPAPNSLFPGLSLTSGGKVFLSCDGDLAYEGFSGRVNLRRNVKIQQEGFVMLADEMTLQLDNSEQATPQAGAQNGVFAGSLQSLDCTGRVEIMTPTQVVHCDLVHYDLKQQVLRLEMRRPEDEVKVYFRDANLPNEFRAIQVLSARHHIDVDTQTEAIVDRADTKNKLPTARMHISPFTDPIPRLRPPAPKTEK
jgi:lipopolysaccharide export system protein LptA